MLALTFEVLSEAAIAALPAALHPPFPTYCSLILRRHDDSPFGPFTTAELRLHARATNHYVGYILGGFTDNERSRPGCETPTASGWRWPRRCR